MNMEAYLYFKGNMHSHIFHKLRYWSWQEMRQETIGKQGLHQDIYCWPWLTMKNYIRYIIFGQKSQCLDLLKFKRLNKLYLALK